MGQIAQCVCVCVSVSSPPWDRRQEEGNCRKGAELSRGWGLEGTPLGPVACFPAIPDLLETMLLRASLCVLKL